MDNAKQENTQTSAATQSVADRIAAAKENSQAAAAQNPAPAVEEHKSSKILQAYHASRAYMQLITTNGTPIIFRDGMFYTDSPEVIAYLDAEISQGLTAVTKGEKIREDLIDPVVAYKNKIIEEYLAEQNANGTGIAGTDTQPSA